MKIGIIGFGNLGRALASGLIKSGSADRDNIYVCDASPDAVALAKGEGFGVRASDDVNFVVANSDVLFVVVKSYVFDKLVEIIDMDALSGKTVVSFMAGVRIEDMHSLVGNNVNVVVAMPSVAIAACDGIIGYTSAPAEVADIFRKLGYAIETAPEDIVKMMAFASCGLGFAAYLIDAFASAGLSMGFSHEECAQIAETTFRNAVERGAPFRDTVSAVATKGGITEKGIFHMDDCGVYGIITQAMKKAYDAAI